MCSQQNNIFLEDSLGPIFKPEILTGNNRNSLSDPQLTVTHKVGKIIRLECQL